MRAGTYVLIVLLIVELKCLYSVLVAHNRFTFDYRILAAEVEHRNLRHELNDNLMFPDTLFDLQSVYSIYHSCNKVIVHLQLVHLFKLDETATTWNV